MPDEPIILKPKPKPEMLEIKWKVATVVCDPIHTYVIDASKHTGPQPCHVVEMDIDKLKEHIQDVIIGPIVNQTQAAFDIGQRAGQANVVVVKR